MAYLYYGFEARPAEIPDHVLAHVKVVVATKLRRGESFLLTWNQTDDGGTVTRTSIWMQPSIPLRFVFDAAEPETLDPAYLRALADEAMSSRGIVLEWDESSGAPPAEESVTAVAA